MRAFDFIIVGGGSAGCALANRLSECGRFSVALLEAGGSHRNPLVRIPFNFAFTVPRGPLNWSFETVSQPGLNGRRGYQPRGKVLGGSSSINAMVYIRGVKEDYDGWAEQGNEGWAYDEVLPYFKKSQNREAGANEFHGVGGPLSVSAVRNRHLANDLFINAGIECQIPHNEDFNGPSQEGIGYYEVTQENGRRCSSAHAYLEPAKGRQNLTIIKHARVHRVNFRGKRAVGVNVSIKGKGTVLHAKKEVVLSAGALQSPQLLLLSGVGAKAQLDRHGIPQVAELPGVGENLHDHIDFSLCYKSSHKSLFGLNPRSIFKVLAKQFNFWVRGEGIMTTNFNESGAFYKADASEKTPDTQLHFAFSIVDDHGSKKHGSGYTCHVCLLRPRSRGRLELESADPEASPLIDPAFLQDERDLDQLVLGVRKAQQIMRSPAMDEIRGTPLYGSDCEDEAELIEDIRNRADTIYHPVGTCKMGPDSDPMAVVDSSLKVRGVTNLRVVDASIMPSIVSGNTNAPSIMIGEKGAAMILDEVGP